MRDATVAFLKLNFLGSLCIAACTVYVVSLQLCVADACGYCLDLGAVPAGRKKYKEGRGVVSLPNRTI